MEKEKIKQNMLPIGIIVCSAISLISSIPQQNYLSAAVSVMGLLGGFLHLKYGKPIWHWIELWIVVQIPYWDKLVFATKEKHQYYNPIYDVSQCIKQTLHFYMYFDDCKVFIGLNIAPLILIGLLMYFKIPYLKTHL